MGSPADGKDLGCPKAKYGSGFNKCWTLDELSVITFQIPCHSMRWSLVGPVPYIAI